MINTILFDLDGTLLPMDFDQFMEHYFYHMGRHFDGWIEPKTLAKAILEATEVMITTNDGRSNSDIFMEHFATLIDGDIKQYEEHFGKYYETLFAHVQASTYPSNEMIEAVQLLTEKGYELVVATNPLFPYRANVHRLSWAGFETNQFVYMSSFEDNNYCKPYPQFYAEVLERIGKRPDECMMVGNDVFDDLPAQKLGIKTYLITDCLINKHNLPNTADHTGSYQDFLTFVKQLPKIK
jgi:FMN phosphatase YigB (HAD superfamily)